MQEIYLLHGEFCHRLPATTSILQKRTDESSPEGKLNSKKTYCWEDVQCEKRLNARTSCKKKRGEVQNGSVIVQERKQRRPREGRKGTQPTDM